MTHLGHGIEVTGAQAPTAWACSVRWGPCPFVS
jgi:hypothetical protein